MARSDFAHIDAREVKKLEFDLRGAPSRVQWQSRRLLAGPVGRLVDREMRRDASGHHGNWFGIPGTSYVTPIDKHVSHEMVTPDRLEVGIESKGAGKIAHLLVYGGPKNAPVYDHMAGPRRALPQVESWFADAVETSVLGDDQ